MKIQRKINMNSGPGHAVSDFSPFLKIMMEFFWHCFSSAIFGLTFYFFLIFRIHPVIYIFEFSNFLIITFLIRLILIFSFTKFGPVLQQFETTIFDKGVDELWRFGRLHSKNEQEVETIQQVPVRNRTEWLWRVDGRRWEKLRKVSVIKNSSFLPMQDLE